MSMVVMEPARRSGLGWVHPRSRTMSLSGARGRVAARLDETGDLVTVTTRGLGEGDFFASVPTWAWWAGGGLLVGLLGGALYFKRKKRKR